MTKLDKVRERAFAMLTSSKTKAAFDVAREPEKVRQRYGRSRMWAVVDDYSEAAAAGARQEALVRGIRQPCCHLSKQRVCGREPEDVVYLFESIDIDTQDTKAFPPGCRSFELAFETPHEGGPVGQIRQPVMRG